MAIRRFGEQVYRRAYLWVVRFYSVWSNDSGCPDNDWSFGLCHRVGVNGRSRLLLSM